LPTVDAVKTVSKIRLLRYISLSAYHTYVLVVTTHSPAEWNDSSGDYRQDAGHSV